MTKQEAKEFLARNPMVEFLFARVEPSDLSKFEPFWSAEGHVRSQADREISLIDVYKALNGVT